VKFDKARVKKRAKNFLTACKKIREIIKSALIYRERYRAFFRWNFYTRQRKKN